MLFIKATFQNVVRRFSVEEDASLLDLKAKLLVVFPELKGVVPDSIQLLYRDSDNDLITISTDEELQTARQFLGPENTLRLIVTLTQQPEEEDDDDDDDFGGIEHLFDSFLHQPTSLFQPFSHSHHPFSHPHHPFSHPHQHGLFSLGHFPTWSDRRQMLQRHEERLRQQRLYEEKMRKAHLENLKNIAKEEEEKRKKVLERRKSSGTEVQTKEGFKPVIPSFPPGWRVSPFGTWEPVTHESPGMTRYVWGPWGYTASYGPEETKENTEEKKEEMEEEKKETEEGKKEEEVKKEAEVKMEES